MSKNSGMQRSFLLIVEKNVADKVVDGYPHTYKLTDSFENYSSISESEFAIMSKADFQNRLSDFKRYVESIEIGLVINTDDAYRENLEACPI